MQKIYYVKAAQYKPDDEFFTPLSLVAEELQHYHHRFKNKVLYCNTDNSESNFVKYLQHNASAIGYKDLLWSDEKFQSDESKGLLSKSDVVITNPPFSLFRKYIKQLYDFDKKFLIIGPVFALTYHYIFEKLTSNKLWLGKTGRNPSKQGAFTKADGTPAPKSYRWFQNITNHPPYSINFKSTNTPQTKETHWEKYDGTEIVNLDRASDVAKCCNLGYDLIGVPVTFFDKYDPSQFRILSDVSGAVNGKNKFKRILLQKL